MFAGPPTLAGASEVGEAFAKSSVNDKGGESKWVFRVPLVAQFGGQTVNDIFGDEVRGLHSTYNAKIKKQVERSMAEGKEGAKDKKSSPEKDGARRTATDGKSGTQDAYVAPLQSPAWTGSQELQTRL